MSSSAAAHLELVFSAANSFALAGWCCLALALLWPAARRLALAFASLLAPCLLAALYAYLLATGLASGATGSFGSLAGVRQLFANDTVLLVRVGQRSPYRNLSISLRAKVAVSIFQSSITSPSCPYFSQAGWVHYLAFDMFVGAWIVRDAIALRVSALLLAPVLFATLMFGPVGLLLYVALRFLVTK
jgi:hypothetical protein